MAGKNRTLHSVKAQHAGPQFDPDLDRQVRLAAERSGLPAIIARDDARRRRREAALNRRLAAVTKPAKLTIEEAFSPHLELQGGDRLRDVERALRAVSLLTFLSTEDGNEPMDGYAAIGLSRIIDGCAETLADLADRNARAAKRKEIVEAERQRAEAKRDRVKRKVA